MGLPPQPPTPSSFSPFGPFATLHAAAPPGRDGSTADSFPFDDSRDEKQKEGILEIIKISDVVSEKAAQHDETCLAQVAEEEEGSAHNLGTLPRPILDFLSVLKGRAQEGRSEHNHLDLIMDLGASMHVTGNLRLLSELTRAPGGSSAAVYHTRHGEDLRIAGVVIFSPIDADAIPLFLPVISCGSPGPQKLDVQLERVIAAFGNRKLIPKHIKEKFAAAFTKESLSEGAPLNSSGYGEERRDSNMYALRAGDGGSSSTGTQVPHLWLDSGATHHFVGDDRILTNLRDLPAGMVVTVANGSQLPVTKVGDIQIQTTDTPDIEITNVYFVPGFEMHLISVHQLAKSKIFTTFYENHAELWLEGTRIGRAIIDDAALLYRLCSLQAPCLKEGGIGIRVGSSTMHMPEHCSLSEGAPLNSSGYGEERRDSNMYALRAGDRGSSPTGTQVPHLCLDSGATHHFVGDDRILTNLRDPPAGMVVTVANGTQLPVTKVGDIQIQIQTTDTPDIEIKDVNLVPGLTMCLVSVRQLAKSKIVTTFYENCAKLRLEGRRIGGAIIDDAALLYRMRYLWPLEAKLS